MMFFFFLVYSLNIFLNRPGIFMFWLFRLRFYFFRNPFIHADVFVILLYLDSDFIKRSIFLIISITIQPNFIYIAMKLTCSLIFSSFKISLYSWQVHRLFNNIKVVISSIKLRIDWLEKRVSTFVFFKKL